MELPNATAVTRSARRGERFFTVATANQALVLVRKVVQDTAAAYGELLQLRRRRHELALTANAQPQLDELRARIEQTVNRLRELEQELTGIGCELEDFARGRVDFPARRDGRRVLLCWQLGEPEATWWHECDAGFSGRRPIGSDPSPGTDQTAPPRTQSVQPDE